jgi:hypothetical protein
LYPIGKDLKVEQSFELICPVKKMEEIEIYLSNSFKKTNYTQLIQLKLWLNQNFWKDKYDKAKSIFQIELKIRY